MESCQPIKRLKDKKKKKKKEKKKKAKVAVCSYILTKHTTQKEHNVEFLNVNPGGT
jgi:hypothetical protein